MFKLKVLFVLLTSGFLILPKISGASTNLQFEENKGQIHDINGNQHNEVFYTLKMHDMILYFCSDKVYYNFQDFEKSNAYNGNSSVLQDINKNQPKRKLKGLYRMDLQWIGCNKNVIPITADKTSGENNYYSQKNTDGILNVHSYKKLTYNNLYNNIDLVYYISNGDLKYDFIVHPGGDPNDIKINYQGADELKIIDNSVKISNSVGSLQELPIYAYQITKQDIKAEYRLTGKVISYNIKDYNKNIDLVIDPIVQKWGTFAGGNGDDYVNGSTVDSKGNTFLSIYTTSTNLPSTTGAYQTTSSGGFDLFILKLDNTGNKEWGTYYSGTSDEYPGGVEVDINGNIYATGATLSTNFPVTSGAYQTSNAGNNDGYLIKLNSSGTRQWATYFGGSNTEIPVNLRGDSNGDMYIVGHTLSTNFPVTSGATQTSNGGGWDCFVIKFNSSGSRQWATYYGGNGEDAGQDIDIDKNDDVYLAAYSASTNFPTTNGAYQTSSGGGFDGYVIKLNSSGVRSWSTLYGGSGEDRFYSIRLDTASNIYVSGFSASTNFPTSNSAYQTSKAGGKDAVLVKLTSSGSRSWATYYGGSSDESYTMLGIDAQQNVWLHGTTFSTGFPVTSDALQSSLNGNADGFFGNFSSAGLLNFSSFLGGSSDDLAFNCHINGSNIYLVGRTLSSDFPVSSSGVMQNSKGTNLDCYMVKMNASSAPTKAATIDKKTAISCGSLKIDWTNGNGTRRMLIGRKGGAITSLPQDELSYKGNSILGKGDMIGDSTFVLLDSTISSTTVSNLENNITYSFAVIEYNVVDSKAYYLTSPYPTVSYVFYKIGPNFKISSGGTCLNIAVSFSDSSSISSSNVSKYEWVFGDGTTAIGASANHIYTNSGKYFAKLKVTSNQGCTDSIERSIEIFTRPLAGFNVDASKQCLINNSFSFSNTSTYNGTLKNAWDFGDGVKSTDQSPIHNFIKAGIFRVLLTVITDKGCTDTISKIVEVIPSPKPAFTINNAEQCKRNNFFSFTNASTIDNNNNLTYVWDFGDGGGSFLKNPDHTYSADGNYTVKLKVYSQYQCADSTTKTITVYKDPKAKFNTGGLCLYQAANFTFDGTAVANSSYFWDFGDGSVSTTQSPKHQFLQPGKYTISLVIKQPNGCQDSISQVIEFFKTPETNFSMLDLGGGNTKFVPTDKTAAKYIWDFGDGDTSSTMIPTHKYNFKGTYNVRLIAYNANNCSDTTDKSVEVNTVGVKEISAAGFDFNIYPNPFTSTATLSLYFPQAAKNACVNLVSLTGQKFTVQKSINLPAGKTNLILDKEEFKLMPGVFFIELNVDGVSYYKKVVLQ